jgi:hypothetical protein
MPSFFAATVHFRRWRVRLARPRLQPAKDRAAGMPVVYQALLGTSSTVLIPCEGKALLAPCGKNVFQKVVILFSFLLIHHGHRPKCSRSDRPSRILGRSQVGSLRTERHHANGNAAIDF